LGHDGQDGSRRSVPGYTLFDIRLDQLAEGFERVASIVRESFPIQPEDPYGCIAFCRSSPRFDATCNVERQMLIRLIAARIQKQGAFGG
jgi:hypothetical protein